MFRAIAVFLAVAAAVLVAAACTREEKHRVLVFFLDGVPPLDAGMAGVDAGGLAGPGDIATEGSPSRAAAVVKFYNHPVYRESRCEGCHEKDAGGLLKTVREGLCLICHPEKPPKKEFVHGPVAVNECLACHRYHRSLHPKVLVSDAQTLCFHCHENRELRTDEHHATIETERCIDCHDAHGGDDRFFLLPKAKAEAVEPS